MDRVQIKEQAVVRTDLIKSFSMTILSVELYKSVSIVVSLYDINDNMVNSKMMYIEGEEYEQWGTSDTYLVQLVATKMGFTLE